jgi:hypothetical protein
MPSLSNKMKTLIKNLALFTLLLFSISSSANAGTTRITAEDNVYLCNGPSSKVYHRSGTCKGLSKCSTQIAKVSLSTAQGKGRRACKIEY